MPYRWGDDMDLSSVNSGFAFGHIGDGRRVEFKAGETLCQQGRIADQVGILVHGAGVGAFIDHPSPQCRSSVLLFRLSIGDIVTPGAILNRPEFYSVRTQNDGAMIMVSPAELSGSTELVLRAGRQFLFYADQLSQRYSSSLTQNLTTRVGEFIAARTDHNGIARIGHKQDLAEELGVTREGVSRAFSKLREAGVTTHHRGAVHVESLERLKAFLAS
jgi:CRP-like cAMP-binding protein